MTTRNLTHLAAALGLAALLAGCGRTVPTFDDAGSRLDGYTGLEQGTNLDLRADDAARGDGPVQCTPSCDNVCKREVQCGLIAQSQVGPCAATCRSNPTSSTLLCLKQLVCKPPPPDCSAARACMNAPKVPDLMASTFSALAVVGGIAFQGRVCNVGNGASPLFRVHFYHNRNAAPTQGEQGDRRVSVAGLAAGQCQVVQAIDRGLSAGTYVTWMQVDAENAVVESKETNNVKGPVMVKVKAASPKPDLRITSLVAGPNSAGTTSYTFTVCNTGTGASSPTSVDLYYNVGSRPSVATPGNVVLQVQGLTPGACAKQSVGASLKNGTYTSWARVDRKNHVKESNENNNVYGPVKVTVGGPSMTDLVVNTLTVNVSPTGSTVYSVVVCNKGKVISGKTRLDVYINRSTRPGASTKGDLSVPMGPISAGGCGTWNMPPAKLKAGTYNSWAYVDRANLVKESNENNNVYGPVRITVTGAPLPDLVIKGLTATPYFGSSFTRFIVTICNQGKAAAGTFYVGVYYDRASRPTASTPPNKSTILYFLAAGACTTRNLSGVLSPGTYRSWAYVDRPGVVKESNETNNVYGPTKVTVPGSGKPDIKVILLSASTSPPGTPFPGTRYYVTICNQGTATAGTSYYDLYYDRASAPPASLPGNQTSYTGSLTAGACVTRSLSTVLPGGTYRSWVRVDRENVVKESNETNNVYGPYKLTIRGSAARPDLQISNVSTSASGSGYYYVYHVTVCNKGKGMAGYAKMELYYDRATRPPASLPGNRYTTLGILQPGACTTRGIYAAIGSGIYTSWLWVDRTNGVLETNENNNLYGPVKVTVP